MQSKWLWTKVCKYGTFTIFKMNISAIYSKRALLLTVRVLMANTLTIIMFMNTTRVPFANVLKKTEGWQR